MPLRFSVIHGASSRAAHSVCSLPPCGGGEHSEFAATSRAKRDDSIAGFTLIEALIATALMAAILSAIATVTSQWLPNWNRGFASVQRNELFAQGFERLVADLAVAEFIPASRQNLAPVFEGTENSVLFVRSALGPNTPAGLEIVRVMEAADVRVPMLVRARAPHVPFTDGYVPRFGDPVVLVRAPYRITFAYAGADRVWRRTWLGSPLLPRAVRLQVRDAATQRVLAVSTATMVHSEVPADCIIAEVVIDCLAGRLKDAAGTEPAPPPPAGPRRP
jgi:general secretion pathway protein J